MRRTVAMIPTVLVALSLLSAVDASAGKQSAQKSFASPETAATALAQSASQYNVPELLSILGPESKKLITSKDPTHDKTIVSQFAEQAKEKTSVRVDPKDKKRATMLVGNQDWPLPIPIVKASGGWRFDTKAGEVEILKRRIGGNELDAISISRGYVVAQKEYASQLHDSSSINQYAQRIISSAGKHDGLAWQNGDGSWGGPVGHAVAKALAEGYSKEGGPFHGYRFKVLKGQGSAAPLGKLDYVIDGAMIGGFAMVAWPADYGVTGVLTFMVSHDGTVYQKDLGAKTEKTASAMTVYNPDSSWKPTNDDWPKAPT